MPVILGCDPTLVTAPEDVRFRAVVAGGSHTCALDADGGAWCWGSNSSGQLGVTRRHASAASPVSVPGGPYRAIAAGERHTCALGGDDRLYCWGANDSGQLGDGGFDERDEPGLVRIDVMVGRFALGGSHTCATDRAGAIWCWGRNDRGQIGPGPSVVPLPTRFAQSAAAGAIAAGAAHSCAVGAAGTFCWGANDHGQLGSATAEDSSLPQRVGGAGVFHTLDLGRAHSCALGSDQRVMCWGSNQQGQAGLPERVDLGTAVPVPTLGADFTFVGAGPSGDLTCVGGTGAAVWCWGLRRDPHLRSVVTRPVPVLGLPAGSLSALAVGDAHACALISDSVVCWGEGSSGQLGDGRRAFSENPVVAGGSAAG